MQILIEETKKSQEQVLECKPTLSNDSEHINILSSQIETLLVSEEIV